MRVAFINHHGSIPGGSERSLEAYLRRASLYCEAHVVLFEDGAYADELRAAGLSVHIAPASQRLLWTTRDELRAANFVDGLRHVVRVRRLLKSLRIDVVVTNSMKAHVIGALAAWLCGIRVVTWWHDLPEGSSLLLLRSISRLCATERVGCSEAVVRRFALPHTTALVPALELTRYVDPPSRTDAREQLGLPQNVLVFSIIGRIARWKGQDRFLRAAARVCRKWNNVHFAIIGSPTFDRDREFAPELLQLAAELGIANRVSFIPWLQDPIAAYAASDLVCNASEAEPFGRTLAEAAACGIPTLCFNDGGAPEAILSPITGTVVPTGDVAAFAAAMAAYAADPSMLRRAGAAARIYVERHDADRLSSVFFEIIRRTGRTVLPRSRTTTQAEKGYDTPITALPQQNI